MTDDSGIASDLAGLLTEQADPRYGDIDAMTTAQLAAIQNAADATVPAAVAAATAAIVAAIDIVVDRLRRGGRLIYVGAGTPGRIATLDAAECPPTFGTSYDQVQAVMAGGQPALTRAVEGIEDDEGVGATDLAALEVTGLDVVLGLSASGRTPYVLGAMRHARAAGAATIGLACNAGAAISTVADVGIEVPVGPELVAGSTRLKAGTAQKLVLNMISTIAMVQLGKTHGNLMVDLAATNQKLRVRAERLVREVTGADDAAARAALAESGQHVKTAIVVIERAVDASTARAMLAAADGRLAHALRAPIGCTPTR